MCVFATGTQAANRMKYYSGLLRTSAFVVAILVAPGCTNNKDAVTSEIQEFAQRYADAWSSSDAQLLASFYTDHGSLQINDGDPAVGRDAIAAVAQSFMTALPDMIVRLDSLAGSREHPQFHWTLIATNSGPDGNGNAIHISGYEEWTLDADGLIEQSMGHMDAAEYQRQLDHGAN